MLLLKKMKKTSTYNENLYTAKRTVETELREMGLTWGEAQKVAKDRDRWRIG